MEQTKPSTAKVNEKYALFQSQLQMPQDSTFLGNNFFSIKNSSTHAPSSMLYVKGKRRRLNKCHLTQAFSVRTSNQAKRRRAKKDEKFALFHSQLKMLLGATLLGSDFFSIKNSSPHVPSSTPSMKGNEEDWTSVINQKKFPSAPPITQSDKELKLTKSSFYSTLSSRRLRFPLTLELISSPSINFIRHSTINIVHERKTKKIEQVPSNEQRDQS